MRRLHQILYIPFLRFLRVNLIYGPDNAPLPIRFKVFISVSSLICKYLLFPFSPGINEGEILPHYGNYSHSILCLPGNDLFQYYVAWIFLQASAWRIEFIKWHLLGYMGY